MQIRTSTILKEYGLKDTQSRRLVVAILEQSAQPISQKEIHVRIEQQGFATNLVTVYRIIETFEKQGIVHRHPTSGGFTLCSMQGHKGHHGFLSCEKCGTVKEFSDTALCKEENRIAQQAGFLPKHHVSEIVGLCSQCI